MSTSPITWNTCPQYAKMQSWGGSKQGGPRCRWTCSWVLKTMSSDILESHFNFFDLVPCIMFLTHLQLLSWKFYGSSTPLLNRNPCSLFLVLSTRFIIHVSCHHSPDFLQSLPCLILKRSSKIHKSLSSNSQIPQVSRLSVGQVFPFSQEIKSMVIYNMLIHIICLVSPILALITPESLLHLLCSPSIVITVFHIKVTVFQIKVPEIRRKKKYSSPHQSKMCPWIHNHYFSVLEWFMYNL